MRISPAAESLLARFVRRGASPPRPQRPPPPIRPRGAARARARSRCRNLQTISPQSAGLCCPLNALTQRLATGIIPYRDSFGGVLSDLRAPGNVGCPARVRACAGGRKVEIYDIFHTHRFRCDDAYYVRTYVVFFPAKARDFSLWAGRVLPTHNTINNAASSCDDVEAECMPP